MHRNESKVVHLSQEQFQYLVESQSLEPLVRDHLRRVKSIVHSKIVLNLSIDICEEIRDSLTEHLAVVGFDEAYAPTSEGVLLETLIDLFYSDY